MARRQVNVFSIEKGRDVVRPQGPVKMAGGDHPDAMMSMLREIRDHVVGDSPAEPPEETAAVPEQFLEDYKAGMDQVMALKGELIQIESAIEQTKREIASLHGNGAATDNFGGVTDELDAVVQGTENATDSILQAAEVIENNAGNLAASLKEGTDCDMAYEIQENVTKIFESCNFQDLTGQRITKVVNTLRYVEERVVKMIEIWGGADAFNGLPVTPMPNPAGPSEMLNGPGSEDDPARATQDDIDALFD